ncbi:MAG: UDP-N-acetylglucosamine 1-carboxyvinyltransferase [Candidatus Colwellbacteria bacterium]|nr:UDP-N-acetylglucosamine 1-carboxyvinyltransferase [Candidatus Colwellbacteria bacterium]
MTHISEWAKIGSKITAHREQKGMTQAGLARLLKTSQSAVARMEAGEQNFSTGTLLKIGKILDKELITLSDETVNFKVEGGHKLKGEVKVNTSKNAAVALLCASLLNKNKTVLKRMPRIEEVYRVIEVLVSLGVSIRWLGNDVEIIPPKKINPRHINVEAAMKTRSVLLLLGPLIHLLPAFRIPQPGGCKLGGRTVRPHLLALEKLGIKIDTKANYYEVLHKRLRPAEIVLYESGDTTTENVLMAAAKIKGKTVIKFASANYMVQDLCDFLTQLGVKIDGVGTTTLTVYGTPEIDKPITYYPSEDPIEAMLFLSIAATTNSSITIKGCPIDFLELELLKLEKMGFKFKILRRYKSANNFTNLVDIRTLPSKLHALEEKIYARPFPGLNIDNLPFFVPIATQAEGQTLIHDWVYENRAIYYMELNKLGADIILADPHRIYVNGPTRLTGAEIICPPALRAAAIILTAMLAASGTSVLRNVYSINRGYEDLANRLGKLGARIKTLRSF